MIGGVLNIIHGCVWADTSAQSTASAPIPRLARNARNCSRSTRYASRVLRAAFLEGRPAAAQSRRRRARVVSPKSPADDFGASKAAHRDGVGLEVAHRKRVNGPIARVFSSTRAGACSPLGDGGGAEGMSGTSGTAQDEQRGRPAPGESRAQPRDNGEREWRCRDALIVAGERLVPEALQGAEIVAVGQPLELGPLVTGDEADSVGVGVNELAEQIQQTDVACNRRRLRREKPQRHAATIISPTPAHRKDRAATTPQFATDSNRRPNPDHPFARTTNHQGLLQLTRFS